MMVQATLTMDARPLFHPGLQQGGALVSVLHRKDLLESEAELAGLRRLEILILEKSLELFFLPGLEVSFVLEPEPAGFL
jgi:hypothetical protein